MPEASKPKPAAAPATATTLSRAMTSTSQTTSIKKADHPLLRFIKFVYRGEPHDPKMLEWSHPILSVLIMYTGGLIILLLAERFALSPGSFINPIGPRACPTEKFRSIEECKAAAHWKYGGALGLSDEETAEFRNKIGAFSIAYWAFILGPRIWMIGPQNVYESLWGCNISLVYFGVAQFLNKPLWTNGLAFALAIDQITWWIDVASFVLKRKFVIGVAKYLTWPECHWFKKVTCGHHLWFWPLICYCLWKYPPQLGNSFPWLATIWMGIVVEFILVIFPRFLLPASAFWPLESTRALAKEKLDHAPHDRYGRPLMMQYLNINLSHGGWKDVKLLPSVFAASWFEGSWWFQYLPYQLFVWAVCNAALSLPFLLFL